MLLGAGAGALTVLLASCTPESTDPKPTRSPEPTVTPTPVGEVPAAAAFLRTEWATDPFALGSRSVTPVGATPVDRETLGTALVSRVFFAGEATDPDRPGTVSGGILSGQRAADEVIDVAEAGERVAVIGAGIAGAIAAGRLGDAELDVSVIEARDRAGGRLVTHMDDDWPVPPQAGAWILGSDDTELASRMGVLGVGTVGLGDATARGADGEIDVPTGDILQQAVADTETLPDDVSLRAALDEAGVQGSPELEEFLAALSAFTGVDPETASSWFPPRMPESPLDAVVSDVAPLVETPLGDLDVTYASPVTGVVYDDRGVSLRLATGEALTFDRVIVTVPLGVLQSDAIEFDPPLPFEKRSAIAALEMGAAESVWLRFDEPFWTTEAGVWHVVGPVGPEPTPSPTPTPTPSPTPGAEGDVDTTIRTWINLLPATGEPILVGLVGGPAARAIAELGDDDLLTLASESLSPFTGA